MIITILLYLAVLFGILIALIFLSPFQVQICVSYNDIQSSGTALFSFIHPWIISVTLDFQKGSPKIQILGKHLKKNIKKNVLPSPLNDYPLKKSSEDDTNKDLPSPQQCDTIEMSETVPENITITALPDPEKPTAQDESYRNIPLPVVENETHSSDTIKKPYKETVVLKKKKKDNIFSRLKQNRFLFFFRNSSWRKKIFKIVLRFLYSLLFLIHFDHMLIFIKAGVNNPMITGTLAGFADALNHMLSNKHNHSFRFEPVFMHNHFESSISFRARTSLFTLVLPVLMLLLTFPYIHTFIIWWRYRRLKKQHLRMTSV